jgi:hypothetical protein
MLKNNTGNETAVLLFGVLIGILCSSIISTIVQSGSIKLECDTYIPINPVDVE